MNIVAEQIQAPLAIFREQFSARDKRPARSVTQEESSQQQQKQRGPSSRQTSIPSVQNQWATYDDDAAEFRSAQHMGIPEHKNVPQFPLKRMT
jgi:hypothetical protein